MVRIKVIIVFLFIGFIGTSFSVFSQPDGETMESLSQEYLPEAMDLLKEWLSIPNDANYPEHVERNIRWCEEQFGDRGFKSKRLNSGGYPLLLLELKSKKRNAQTILFYAHADGQPVDTSKWNQESPYIPVIKEKSGNNWEPVNETRLNDGYEDEWRIFARSASDDKGPIAMFLTALDIVEKENLRRDINIKVILDFEEEQGSPSLPATVKMFSEELEADMMVNMDGPRHITNQPTLTFGARGIATVQIKVYGPVVPQHSGHYGNYAPNPAFRLARLLSGMKDENGRVTLPGFYDGVELSDADLAILESVPDDEDMIRNNLGIAEIDGVADTYQKAIQYPSLNIRGMNSGWVEADVRTIVPSVAIAEIDIRLVKETDGDRLVKLVKDYIEEQGYYLTDGAPTAKERREYGKIASFRSRVSYPAFRTDINSEAGDMLSSALKRAFGKEPVKQRTSGGSIPISPFVEALDIPVVSVPTVNRDNNQHSPNENLRIGNYREGIMTFLAVLTER